MSDGKQSEHKIVTGLRRLVQVALTAACVGAVHAAPPAAEQTRIDRLIDCVASQKDAKFVRNGTAYDGADAARFLRGKLEKMGAQVTTANHFIEQIGSRSSTTGELYWIRFSDGRKVPAGRFLQQELNRLDASQ